MYTSFDAVVFQLKHGDLSFEQVVELHFITGEILIKKKGDKK